MDTEEMLRTLREEAETHTPDVRERVLQSAATSPAPAQGEALVKTKRTGFILAAVLALVCILLAAFLIFFQPQGGTENFKLVVSINPSVEFTLEDGKVTSTRALNRDCAVLLKGGELTEESFAGETAEDACLKFVSLADGKRLIGADGIKLHIEGGDRSFLDGIQAAISVAYGQYSVADLDETSFSDLISGYNESEMGDFEDWLEREFEGKRDGFEGEIFSLLEGYENALGALDTDDGAAVEAFNQAYLKLGEDLIFEDGDETKEELLREYRELSEKLEKNPGRVMDELFREFLDELEDLYEDTFRIGDDDDDDDYDDDDDDDDRDEEEDDDD